MIQFNKNYLLFSAGIFATEILIAIFVKDAFIRPYFGDFLAAILVYTFLKSFGSIGILKAAIISLLFSYVIELMQFVDFLHLTGLQDYKIIRIVLGSSFSWADLLAYTLGIMAVLFFENRKLNVRTTPKSFSN